MLLYRAAKKPDGPLGMALFLFLGRAGDGAVVGDNWYHFSRGKFVRSWAAKLRRRQGYIIQYIREATPEDIEHFESTVGRPWGWRFNCLTTVTWWLMRNQ